MKVADHNGIQTFYFYAINHFRENEQVRFELQVLFPHLADTNKKKN
jgi:hypothetical protein